MFVSDWEPEQVRTLTQLLEKLQSSMTAASAREKPSPSERRRARRTAQAVRRKED
jgi:hypothetical protein